MNICVLGAGAWGTALAIAFARRHAVSLWARNAAFANTMQESRTNSRYLSGVELPAGVTVNAEFQSCVSRAELVVIATPISGMREVTRRLAVVAPRVPVIWLCKGFEQDSACLPHEIVAAELPGDTRCAVLSGPSFAQEVARGQPTALVLASRDADFARQMTMALHQTTLRIYFSVDVIGVEVAAAVKNVMAIATGICDGMSLGMNARAALITRGLAEIARLGSCLGGRGETFMGLAGAGDLILTCTGDLSRNRSVGLQLARGESLAQILQCLGHVAEGVYSASEVQRIAVRHGVEMPITHAVCEVLFTGKTPADALRELLARDPKLES